MSAEYKDLEDYGIIGNLETCALIGRDGSIDWLCLPFLDSPSIFGALLDIEKGGHFYIKPSAKFESNQAYSKNTNVLKTTFVTGLGKVVLTDFMKVKEKKNKNFTNILLRKVECLKGQMDLDISFKPCFNYGRFSPAFKLLENSVIAQGEKENIILQSPIPLTINDKSAGGKIGLKAGETIWFILQSGQKSNWNDNDCEKLLIKTKEYWRNWSERSVHSKVGANEPWHDLVVRTGLTLQLLTTSGVGSVAAAATTSLPETIGGVRNWDYRYAWIRDASFTVQALFHLGHIKESKDFRHWIWEIIEKYKDPSQIQIMYGLRGRSDLTEQILDNLSGYKNSSPVRIGNAAAKQKQLDIFGELLNMVYETTRYGEMLPQKRWKMVKELVNYVCKVWDTKDSGIWETRGSLQHFVYSKLMCWVAIDRGIKLSKTHNFNAPLETWEKERDALREKILKRGFNKNLNSFVQSFDSDTLDATCLLIPMMGFLPFDDLKVQGTIDAILKNLTTKDGLVYRYRAEDGLPGTEGNFIICSFWLVKVLALSGRVNEAEEIFLKILKYVSPLGLLAEEVDPKIDKQIGNFPQAFSHIGLINSALYLGIAKGKEHAGPKPMGM